MKRRLTMLLSVATVAMTVACSGGHPAQNTTPRPSPSVIGKAPRIIGTPPSRVRGSVEFSGYRWRVTHQPRGTPPTTVGGFSGRHAWVDNEGRLNLRLQRIGKAWQGGAVSSTTRGWGYGTYEWTVEGRIDGFNKNVVVGLFTYEQGAPGNREIDIEFARFGRTSGRPNMSSTLHYRNGDAFSQNWAIGRQQRTTHSFTWQPDRVTWITRDANNEIIHRTEAPTAIRPGNERVHMNIWICCGRPPNRPQQIVISSFNFRPYTRS